MVSISLSIQLVERPKRRDTHIYSLRQSRDDERIPSFVRATNVTEASATKIRPGNLSKAHKYNTISINRQTKQNQQIPDYPLCFLPLTRVNRVTRHHWNSRVSNKLESQLVVFLGLLLSFGEYFLVCDDGYMFSANGKWQYCQQDPPSKVTWYGIRLPGGEGRILISTTLVIFHASIRRPL
jgi:hypothetical protein